MRQNTRCEKEDAAMHFIPTKTNWEKSPFTGLDRNSWVEAGIWLLQGAFAGIHSIEDPMIVPRTETEITYPHQDAAGGELIREQSAERFEGLTRTFFIGSMLIHVNPDTAIHGIRLSDYYRRQILRSVDPRDSLYVGSFEDCEKLTGTHGPFQQTVETCALAIGLWACRETIWDTFDQKEKDSIAAFLLDWAVHNTSPNNWRLFNMLDLAFLSMMGYQIDTSLMLEYASLILNDYAGDGWYRDGKSADYYACWAYQFYIPIWCLWYGYEKAPELASLFEERSRVFHKTYPGFFDRDGHMAMFGRSCIYRFASAGCFPADFLYRNPTADPGLVRRICSGVLMQFLSRDELLSYSKGIPSIGFYGPFPPLVQSYSCAESVYWLGKIFLCLYLPANHPFWTAVEKEGKWKNLHRAEQTCLAGPGIVLSHHPGGETILRTAKVIRGRDDVRGLWNYGRLCFHTKFPWEARSESQQYLIRVSGKKDSIPNAILYSGYRDGVFYRREFFGYVTDLDTGWMDTLDLADFPVSSGILRVDRLQLCSRPSRIILGSFGFPDFGTVIQEKKGPSGQQALVVSGKDCFGKPIQMAMSVIFGWNDISVEYSSGTNPEAKRSVLLVAEASFGNTPDVREPHVLISQVLTRQSDVPFTDEELFPVKDLFLEDPCETGSFGSVRLILQDGTKKCIDYGAMEGNLSM